MKRRILVATAALAALVLAGFATMASGIVSIGASGGHWTLSEWLLRFGKRRSIATHSIGIDAPQLDDRLVRIGAGHYHGGCQPCHGAPGMAPLGIAPSMLPSPPDLQASVYAYDDAALFYVVRHGIKLTGMPAWPATTRDDEVWAVVAFLRALSALDAEGYRSLVFGEVEPHSGAPQVVTAQCARCHGSDGLGRGVFPKLAGQPAGYLHASLRAYATGGRHSGIMRIVALRLDDTDMHDAARWYASRPPPAGTGEASALGADIAAHGLPSRRIPACNDCHAASERHHDRYPRLAGQDRAYLAQQLRLFIQRRRGGSDYAGVMQQVTAHALEDGEIDAVAAFYAAMRR